VRNSSARSSFPYIVTMRTLLRLSRLAAAVTTAGLTAMLTPALPLVAGSAQALPQLGNPPLGPTNPACAAGALRATYTIVTGSNATSHVEYTLTVTNRSHARCTVGVPLSLTLLGAHGQALPTAPQFSPSSSYAVSLAPGQSAQAVSELSPDLAGPGESTHGNCEPMAHALRITVGTGAVRAAMDPTPVCQRGAISFRRLAAVAPTPTCSPTALTAAFRRQDPPFDGFATYSLTLRNRSSASCHVDSIVGLRLLGAHGRRLATTLRTGVSAPLVIGAHVRETASARLATRGGHCDAMATGVSITPARGGRGLTTAVTPAVAVCRRGLIQLTSLFRNG
jgi:hypothetical protein